MATTAMAKTAPAAAIRRRFADHPGHTTPGNNTSGRAAWITPARRVACYEEAMTSPTLSLVAPAYNEERNLPAFLAAVVPVMESIGEPFEIVFVDDGSRDGTLGMLAAAASQDPRIKVVGLARNFGKDVALSAGLAHATGRAAIPIDCDLQHPPALIPQFVAKWREGYDMVIGVRSKRDEEGVLRRTLSRTYYKVMRSMTSVEIPANAGDFRLIDRKILDVID